MTVSGRVVRFRSQEHGDVGGEVRRAAERVSSEVHAEKTGGCGGNATSLYSYTNKQLISVKC